MFVINHGALNLGQILREVHLQVLHFIMNLRKLSLVLVFGIGDFEALLDNNLLETFQFAVKNLGL